MRLGHKLPIYMKKSYSFLLQWLIIAFIAGIVGSITIHVLIMFYQLSIGFLQSLDQIPLFVWPALGAVIVGFIIYRIEPSAKGEGLPSYIVALRESGGRLSISETLFKFCAAVMTLGTFGNGGFLGPGGRVAAGVMSALRRLIPEKLIASEHTLLFPICGLAAAFAALVHSSIGAGIFAVEIIQKSSMRYRQLFPAILASTVSVYFSKLFGFEPVFIINAAAEAFNMRLAGIIILLSIVAGLAGRGFTMMYAVISKLFNRDLKLKSTGVAFRAIAGSVIAFFVVYFINPELIGTSTGIFNALLNGGDDVLFGNLNRSLPLFIVIILLMFLKALANSITVGSGMSAGFAGPAMLIGLLCGAAFSSVLGIEFGTAEYFALLAVGFTGVFSSTMNTPIAIGGSDSRNVRNAL